MSILGSIARCVPAIMEHITRYNDENVDLSNIYLYIDAENYEFEITNTKEFQTLENPVLVCPLNVIDPNALMNPADINSEFTRDAITRLIASFILRSR